MPIYGLSTKGAAVVIFYNLSIHDFGFVLVRVRVLMTAHDAYPTGVLGLKFLAYTTDANYLFIHLLKPPRY